ncbi:bifunctional [glutamate--ammonia ligase]-adenylyl-L-tyrosine phosphorylase/[glutamate--ammonia-ligase] adenylyltransferase [Derxia lacustris]|uniref:bifunctional [glutamate--ammonia ligase]-adenylyl-L-tyrosine phosphorylase/[glutamate--ammonia-ligase] adenylyltransferase n=1 Tax=Derxia lacustris TaxID=764842 RepID=UPI000A17514E|nr:bifunctional [glutamate--ammonia ligase]-adenylyl-L-tyrosine phosphorylase/[glutamate--ammonia-ligase] adenylyltransferase [Derxia lacustris]
MPPVAAPVCAPDLPVLAPARAADPTAPLAPQFSDVARRLIAADPARARWLTEGAGALSDDGDAPVSPCDGALVVAAGFAPAPTTWAGAPAPLARFRLELADRLDTLLAEPAGAAAPDLAAREALLRRALRQLRAETLLRAMEGDLAGRWTLADVTAAMSALAELAIQRAADLAYDRLAAIHGTPRAADGGDAPEPFIVIGMGKLGGGELNVSSDIDLIFMYRERGETAGGSKPIGNHEFFVQLGRRVMGMISELDGDGYVFRVDMRLRPNGDAGPLATSYAMLEEYLHVQGREWERYAWIKARIVAASCGSAPAPDIAALECELEPLRRPFVFRKYLDFGAIGAMRELHRQIRAEGAARAARRPALALDVKLGRGGIREIEFIAQVFQLIRGGREPRLQCRPTCFVLDQLARLGLMPRATVDGLIAAYDWLRGAEHRVQYIDDAQTHHLPASDEGRARVAAMMGAADAAALLADFDRLREFVAGVFDAVFATDRDGENSGTTRPTAATASAAPAAPGADADAAPPALARDWFPALAAAPAGTGLAAAPARTAAATASATAPADDSATLARDAATAALAAHGYAQPAAVADRLAALARSPRLRALPDASRERLLPLLDRILAIAARHDDPPALVARFADLLDAIARRSAYLVLLAEYPAALDRVAAVLAASPWAAAYLRARPLLLDELLAERAALAVDWRAEREALDARLAATVLPDGQPDIERRMDVLRETQHLWTFRLLAEDLAGRLTVEKLADALSDLADTIVGAALDACWQQVRAATSIALPDRPGFAVIAYGKLGGREIGYASDLDLIFLFREPDDAAFAERAQEIYGRFAQRLLSWLTTHTAAGRLFDVDMRLRPNGNAGLLVSSWAAFERYQAGHGSSNTAWVWEHQALTRARFCAGDAELGRRFEALRRSILTAERDPAATLAEIVAMRRRMHDGHPNKTALFDLKHDRGGMVDIEFIVQALVLVHSQRFPELADDAGNIALLARAASHDLLPAELAARVGDAYRHFRAEQHRLRLAVEVAAGPSRVPPDSHAAERDAVTRAWDIVFGAAAPDASLGPTARLPD